MLRDSRIAVRRYDLLIPALALALLFLWPGLWRNLLNNDGFMSHGYCYLWIPALVTLHVVSDSVIGVTYLSISITLACLVYSARRDIPFSWVFIAFGLFIAACGATHLLEVWTLWSATYWLSGYVKLVTAVASLATAIALPTLIPKVLSLINSAKLSDERLIRLEEVNCELEGLRAREQQRSEAELKASQARFARLAEANVIGVFMANLEGQITEANDAFLHMLGYTRDDLLSERIRWNEITPREQLDADVQKFAEARKSASGACTPWEKEYIHRNGRRVPVLIGSALLEKNKEDVIAFVIDLTERKHVEQELIKSEERYRSLANAMPQIVWTANPDGWFDYYNDRWVEYTGLTVEQTKEWGWQPVVHPDDVENCIKLWTEAVAAGDRFESEFRYKRASDGRYRWHLGRALPSRDSEGRIIKWIGTSTDIEDQKRAQERIRQFNETLERKVAERTIQLEELNGELEAFSSSVSHDLRAPLRHVGGFGDLLQKHSAAALDDVGRRYLQTILDSAKYAGTLVDDLLDFSRMGRTELKHSQVDLSKMAGEIVREFDLETTERNILWKMAELPVVQGDAAMLRLVWRNLISNAVKYTRHRERAEIELGYRDEAGEHVFFVRDNGVGFDMRYVDKLFGVFQRLHGHNEFEGTGIGLANVRRIIRRHGGRVRAEGAVDGGATFYFSLPRTEPREAVTRKDENNH